MDSQQPMSSYLGTATIPQQPTMDPRAHPLDIQHHHSDMAGAYGSKFRPNYTSYFPNNYAVRQHFASHSSQPPQASYIPPNMMYDLSTHQRHPWDQYVASLNHHHQQQQQQQQQQQPQSYHMPSAKHPSEYVSSYPYGYFSHPISASSSSSSSSASSSTLFPPAMAFPPPNSSSSLTAHHGAPFHTSHTEVPSSHMSSAMIAGHPSLPASSAPFVAGTPSSDDWYMPGNRGKKLLLMRDPALPNSHRRLWQPRVYPVPPEAYEGLTLDGPIQHPFYHLPPGLDRVGSRPLSVPSQFRLIEETPDDEDDQGTVEHQRKWVSAYDDVDVHPLWMHPMAASSLASSALHTHFPLWPRFSEALNVLSSPRLLQSRAQVVNAIERQHQWQQCIGRLFRLVADNDVLQNVLRKRGISAVSSDADQLVWTKSEPASADEDDSRLSSADTKKESADSSDALLSSTPTRRSKRQRLSEDDTKEQISLGDNEDDSRVEKDSAEPTDTTRDTPLEKDIKVEEAETAAAAAAEIVEENATAIVEEEDVEDEIEEDGEEEDLIEEESMLSDMERRSSRSNGMLSRAAHPPRIAHREQKAVMLASPSYQALKRILHEHHHCAWQSLSALNGVRSQLARLQKQREAVREMLMRHSADTEAATVVVVDDDEIGRWTPMAVKKKKETKRKATSAAVS